MSDLLVLLNSHDMKFQSLIDRIYKHGLNPCVDIPEIVIRAFRAHAQSGRVYVEGTLNEAPVRAVLIPVSGGRHRLFINGAMRRGGGA